MIGMYIETDSLSRVKVQGHQGGAANDATDAQRQPAEEVSVSLSREKVMYMYGKVMYTLWRERNACLSDGDGEL